MVTNDSNPDLIFYCIHNQLCHSRYLVFRVLWIYNFGIQNYLLLGVYKKLPNREFNGKPLYRKVNGDDYLYFWKYTDPDNDFGHNWIVR